MNLGLTKQDAEFVENAIIYFVKSFKKSALSIHSVYPNVNIEDLLNQLYYIIELGDDAVEGQKLVEYFFNTKGNDK